MIGESCPSILINRKILAIDVPMVLIERDYDDALASFIEYCATFGVTDVGALERVVDAHFLSLTSLKGSGSDKILVVQFDQVDDKIEEIWNWCYRGGVKFDAVRCGEFRKFVIKENPAYVLPRTLVHEDTVRAVRQVA